MILINIFILFMYICINNISFYIIYKLILLTFQVYIIYYLCNYSLLLLVLNLLYIHLYAFSIVCFLFCFVLVFVFVFVNFIAY